MLEQLRAQSFAERAKAIHATGIKLVGIASSIELLRKHKQQLTAPGAMWTCVLDQIGITVRVNLTDAITTRLPTILVGLIEDEISRLEKERDDLVRFAPGEEEPF